MIRAYPPNAVRAERSEGIARRAEQAVRGCTAERRTPFPKLAVRYNESFHDRFLIIDDKELYLIGASLKDLGRKCFAFTKLDPAEIRRIKKTAFGRDKSE